MNITAENEEDNAVNGRTTTFKYDAGGNLAQRSYYDFTLDDNPGQAPDIQIFLYDGNRLIGTSDGSLTISYDAIGNPLSYAGENAYAADSFDGHRTITGDLSWSGRELIGATGYLEGSPATATYSYDADGRRLTKSLTAPPSKTGMFQWDSFDVNYTYIWSGETFIGFKIECPFLMDLLGFDENSSVLTRVIYNEIGDSIGYFYAIVDENLDILLGDMVWYVKNVFGDITGLYSEQTQALELSYSYDAWGTPASENSGSIFGIFMLLTNQLTYRGYFYDFETGLYYLRSRYYSPSWGRFLNADKHFDTGVGVLGTNMYIYCNNNPVMYTDHSGEYGEKGLGKEKFIEYDKNFCFEVVVKSNNTRYYEKNDGSKEKSDRLAKDTKLTILGGWDEYFCFRYDGKKHFILKSDVKPIIPSGLVIDNGYFIRNTKSGRYLDVSNGDPRSGTAVQQHDFNFELAQFWFLRFNNSSGYAKFEPLISSNMRLTIGTDSAQANQANQRLQIANRQDVKRQRFIIAKDGITYRIISMHSVFGTNNKFNTFMNLGVANNNNATPVTTRANGGDAWAFMPFSAMASDAGGVYRHSTSREQNCYGYVLNRNEVLIPKSRYIFGDISDITGKPCRTILSYDSPISNNEYRAAYRFRPPSQGGWHIVYQLTDGTWAGKHGIGDASQHFKDVVDPGAVPDSHPMWNPHWFSPNYPGPTRYVAITR